MSYNDRDKSNQAKVANNQQSPVIGPNVNPVRYGATNDQAASSNDSHDALLEGEASGSDVPSHSPVHVSKTALACLLAQHSSSRFGCQVYSFAMYIFLVEAYKDTIAPAALVGLGYTSFGALFAGWVGSLVDRMTRMRFVRLVISLRKILQITNYSLFFILFGPLKEVASPAFHGRASTKDIISTWAIVGFTFFNAGSLHLANVGMDVAIERDWVTAIAQGDSPLLTRLNASMRTVDLLFDLMSPLFVSLLTITCGYTKAVMGLMIVDAMTLILEFWWIQVVYNQFPALHSKKKTLGPGNDQEEGSEDQDVQAGFKKDFWSDWADFASMPIFYSALAQGLSWLSTLDFGGVGVSYFKIGRGWDDGFLAGIRMLCIVASCFASVSMPFVEKYLGLRSSGVWGIWGTAAFLIPSVVTFFLLKAPIGVHGPLWSSILMFGGIIMSRYGKVIFDLAQIKQLQQTLEYHPKQNQLTALQFSLISLAGLFRYTMVFILSSPGNFKWTTLITLLSLASAGLLYMIYIGRTR